MVEGATLIGVAVEAGWEIEAEFVRAGTAHVSTAPWFELADGVLERVASTEHPQPNLAIVKMPAEPVTLAGRAFVVAADRLADPGNLGTILRSAEAAGADAVVLTPGSVDPFNPKVVRASAGSLFLVPIVTATLDDVRAAGFRLVGTSSHQGIAHTDADWSGRVAVVLGSEAHGLDPSAPIDEWVRIEHRGRTESLNVAMVATLLAFAAAQARGR